MPRSSEQHQTSAEHVLDAVVMHRFRDTGDWWRGLGELDHMTDAEIEALAAEAYSARKGEQK